MAAGHGRVMIVDDHEMVRSCTVELLRLQGWDTIAFESGEEAVRHLEEGAEVDVALVDAVMPGMDGMETLDAMRRLRPDLRVIIISGQETSAHSAELAERRVDGLLSKPFSASQLTNALEAALRSPRE